MSFLDYIDAGLIRTLACRGNVIHELSCTEIATFAAIIRYEYQDKYVAPSRSDGRMVAARSQSSSFES